MGNPARAHPLLSRSERAKREVSDMKRSNLSVAALGLSLALAGNAALANNNSEQPVADTVITTKVKAELARDDATKARDINVTTVDGVVTLSGAVDSSAEKKKAEKDARNIKGVMSVDNQLTVKK
jgi:hyperosmotically inducible periplasmic protein